MILVACVDCQAGLGKPSLTNADDFSSNILQISAFGNTFGFNLEFCPDHWPSKGSMCQIKDQYAK